MNIFVNIKPVSTDTRLPRVTVFGAHRTRYSGINIGILKHNKGRVTAKL